MILSIDDGCASDVRVAELAHKYDVKTVFYWPAEWHSLAHENGYKPLAWSDAKAIENDFEIGSHTITHRHLTKIPLEEAITEIIDSKSIIENMFLRAITKFAPPRGYTNEALTKVTLSLYDSQRLTKGPGLVHIHPDSGANNNMPWREYARTHEITEAWGHSWEFDKYDLWAELEAWLKEQS